MSAPTANPDTWTRLGTAVFVEVGEQLDDGSTGPDGVAHYVDQRIDGQDVAAAMINGTELIALCGYRWVPFRDPRKLPVCKRCAVALESILRGGGA